MDITAQQLMKAIATEEITLHYQPIYALRGAADDLAGFEALSRWYDIPPPEFIGAAQAHGLLEPFCRWVFRKAIAQAADWNLQQHGLWLAVNLNPTHLLPGGLAGDIKGMAIAVGLDPLALHLEITEGEDLGRVELDALRILAKDFVLGVDDFGSGFSNLSHVAQAPIAFLKIDRSLCPSGIGDRKKIDLLHTVVLLARRLDIATVLEGIETYEQRAIAVICGVDFGQGWYWSQAVSAAIARKMF